MTKLIYLAFLLFITNVLIAQPVIKEFQTLNVDKEYRFVNFIDADETGFYISTVHKTARPFTYFVEKRNKNTGDLIFEIKLEHKPCYSICTNNKIIVVYSELNNENDSRKLSCSIFSSVDGIKIKDKEIEEIGGQKLGPYKNDYLIIASPDKSKLLMIPNHNDLGFPNPKAEQKSMKMYNSTTMELIWELKVDLSLSSDAVIDNIGNILCPYKSYIRVVRFKSDKERDINVSLKLPQRLTTAIIGFTKDGQATATGMFTETIEEINEKGEVKLISGKAGFYYTNINISELKLEKERIEYFTPEIEQKLSWQDKGRFVNKNPGDKEYKALKMFSQNGEVYFIAEHRLQKEWNYSYNEEGDVENNKSNFLYEHKEIIITKFSQSGHIEWTRILPKETVGALGGLQCIFINDKICFVFLDEKSNTQKFTLDNYEAGKLKPLTALSNSNALCITIDKNGNAKRNVLFFYSSYFLLPKSRDVIVDNKTLLIYLGFKTSDKIGTLTFD